MAQNSFLGTNSKGGGVKFPNFNLKILDIQGGISIFQKYLICNCSPPGTPSRLLNTKWQPDDPKMADGLWKEV